jgi:predicted dehydrogenase
MSTSANQAAVRIAIIGAGAVSDYHHVPGIRLDPRAELVAVCDSSESLLEQRRSDWSIDKLTTDYEQICQDPEIDAVIIATPNFTHCPMAIAAAKNGKHIMCEKPLGLHAGEVQQMVDAAEQAGVVHMTAFTYRFAPSMRYLRQLAHGGELGELRHFRSQRFLDWPETSWGWRQYKETAGAGDLFDMTIHRIDFGMDLMGPIDRLCGAANQFTSRQQTVDGEACPPSDVDDWSAIIGVFRDGGVGVWEGTTLAKGYNLNGFGHEWAEINGSEASAVYRLHEPNTLLIGRHGGDLEAVDVPSELLSPAGSPRDPADGEPATVFRYDLVWEFVSAIVEGRAAVPSFEEGRRAQVVADAVLVSGQERNWVDLSKQLG